MRFLSIGSPEGNVRIIDDFCRSEYGWEHKSANNFDDAISILKAMPIRLIIIYLPTDDDPSLLFSILNEQKERVPIVFGASEKFYNEASKEIPFDPLTLLVNYSADILQVHFNIKRIVRISERQHAQVGAYLPVPLEIFVTPKRISFDLYIQLNESKNVRIFKKGDILNKSDIERYKEKSLSHFFLRFDDYKRDSREIILTALKQVKKTPKSIVKLASISKQAHSATYQLISRLQIEHEVLEVADIALKSLCDTIAVSKNNSILKHINKILSEENYLSSHTVSMAILSVAMVRETKWATDYSYDKLIASAFFHDLCLVNVEIEQSGLKKEQLDTAFQKKEIEAYLNHPRLAAELVANIEGLPIGIDRIILHHHELPDGTGFPHRITHKQITPLATILIIAEAFTKKALHSHHSEFPVIFERIKENYSASGFKVALEALFSLLK